MENEPIENIEQLKPCPFCGEQHIWTYKVSFAPENMRYVMCAKDPEEHDGCVSGVSVSAWNTRPIEDALRAELVAVRDEYLSAAALVANMHKAAIGEVTGPVLGVVEDVANVRAEVARLTAERDSLRAELNSEIEISTAEGAYHDQAKRDVERLQAELEAVSAAGQRDAALAISLYQDNQKLKDALDGTHLAFVHASEELQQARDDRNTALDDASNLQHQLDKAREALKLCLPIVQSEVYEFDDHGVCFFCGEEIDSGDEHKPDCKQLVAYLAARAALPEPPQEANG